MNHLKHYFQELFWWVLGSHCRCQKQRSEIKWYTEEMKYYTYFIIRHQSSKILVFSIFSYVPYEKDLWCNKTAWIVWGRNMFIESTHFNNINTKCSPIWLFLLDKIQSLTLSLLKAHGCECRLLKVPFSMSSGNQ